MLKMGTQIEQACLDELLRRVKVCTVWDGYDATEDPKEQNDLYEIYRDKYGITLPELFEQIKYSSGSDDLDFSATNTALSDLVKLAKNEAAAIAKNLSSRGLKPEQVADVCFEHLAKKFVTKNTGKLLITVPHPWVPIQKKS